MGDVVNLRLARKGRDRQRREKEAASNRAAFGTPKAERERLESERDLARRALEGHRLTPPDES